MKFSKWVDYFILLNAEDSKCALNNGVAFFLIDFIWYLKSWNVFLPWLKLKPSFLMVSKGVSSADKTGEIWYNDENEV